MSVHHFTPAHWHSVLAALPAALRVADGDVIITQTIDANGFDKEGVRQTNGSNPMNGPFHVDGAMPGDVLQVDILRMDPIRPQGWTRGALAANVVDPERVRDLPPRDRIDWDIDLSARTLRLREPIAGLEHLVLPLEPMIGCFGVAPAGGEAISTATSAANGGNMDYRGFGPGARIWFPVFEPGALFFLGDCHALQGDGEIVGTGVETAMEVEFRLIVLKNRQQAWPRGETAETIYTIGNARPLEQALQHATTEMFDWLTGEEYGLSSVAASHLMGQLVRYDVGNVFDPAYTMACHMPKKFLPTNKRPR